VKENPLQQLFSTETGEEKRVFTPPLFVGAKLAFHIDNSANHLKNKQLALMTELFCLIWN
jgi:hypothetical protein